jgi:hypothetical protein
MTPEVVIRTTGAPEAEVLGEGESMTWALDEGNGGRAPAKLAVATLTTVELMLPSVQ